MVVTPEQMVDISGEGRGEGSNQARFRRRPWGRARTPSRDYMSRLAWERFVVPLDKLEEVPRGEGGLGFSV